LKEKYPKAQRFLFNDHQKKKGTKVPFDLQEKDALKLCILFCSSTGNGEFPENGENMHKFLRRHTLNLEDGDSSKMLSHVSYTILGLGDSNYSKYQGAPRYLDANLGKLGAQKFYNRGEADEATSLELVVEPWLEGVWDAIDKEVKKIKALQPEKVKELLTPVLIEEPKSEEMPKEMNKVDQMTTYAKVKKGRFLINKPGER
jgi:methionine synthase reductase